MKTLELTDYNFVGISVAHPKFRVYYYNYTNIIIYPKKRYYAVITRAGSERQILKTDYFQTLSKCKKEVKSILAEL